MATFLPILVLSADGALLAEVVLQLYSAEPATGELLPAGEAAELAVRSLFAPADRGRDS